MNNHIELIDLMEHNKTLEVSSNYGDWDKSYANPKDAVYVGILSIPEGNVLDSMSLSMEQTKQLRDYLNSVLEGYKG